MNQLVSKIFDNEITEAGIADLERKYPADMEFNMEDDDEFKTGRKIRTEKNKVVDGINRKRIDFTAEVKKYGDSLVSRVESIYQPVISAFENEDAARKLKAQEEKRKYDEKITKENARINDINGFIKEADGKSSADIQGLIEAVDLIETSMFHKDVIHNAIDAKKHVLTKLSRLFSIAVSSEKVEAEREELRIKTEEENARQYIEKKINDLRMVPSTMFGKNSGEIESKINLLKDYAIEESVFGDRASEANTAKELVISQLEMMFGTEKRNEETIETLARIKAEEDEKKAKEAGGDRMRDSGVGSYITIEDKETIEVGGHDILIHKGNTGSEECIDDLPIEQTPEVESSITHSLVADLAEFCDRYELSLLASEELEEILSFYDIEIGSFSK